MHYLTSVSDSTVSKTRSRFWHKTTLCLFMDPEIMSSSSTYQHAHYVSFPSSKYKAGEEESAVYHVIWRGRTVPH
jgi:hypothetical protein